MGFYFVLRPFWTSSTPFNHGWCKRARSRSMNKPQHNPPQHFVHVSRGKEKIFSVLRNCFVIVQMAQIQYYYYKYLITRRAWFSVCEHVHAVHPNTHSEIPTMHCCLSSKCPKVHHNQMAQKLNGSSPWITRPKPHISIPGHLCSRHLPQESSALSRRSAHRQFKWEKQKRHRAELEINVLGFY